MDQYLKKWKLIDFIKYLSPSIAAMVFTSLFTIADGFFVGQGVGPNALAAVNIVMPVVSLIFGISIMFTVGGSTLTAISIGSGDLEKGKQDFNLTMAIVTLSSFIIGVALYLNQDSLLSFLGATDKLMEYARDYLSIMVIALPFFALKICFEFFMRTDGRPEYSMISTIIGGIGNIIFNYFFIFVYDWGIKGAAYGTLVSVVLSNIVGIYYFIFNAKVLRFSLPKFDLPFITQSAFNGSSEMVSELSMGITTFLFNIIVLKYAGENGVAAISVILYLQFIVISIMLGFNMGIQPVISYNYGADNCSNVKDLAYRSLLYVVVISLVSSILVFLFSNQLVSIFLDSSSAVFPLAKKGLIISTIGMVLMGSNLFISTYFTAINNGKYSALIAFSRSLLFLVVGLLVLPIPFEITGVWLSIPFAEITTIVLAAWLFVKKNRVLVC